MKCNKCGKETKRASYLAFCLSCEKKVTKNCIDDLVKNQEYHSARIRNGGAEVPGVKQKWNKWR